jgi:hypothetical protein
LAIGLLLKTCKAGAVWVGNPFSRELFPYSEPPKRQVELAFELMPGELDIAFGELFLAIGNIGDFGNRQPDRNANGEQGRRKCRKD